MQSVTTSPSLNFEASLHLGRVSTQDDDGNTALDFVPSRPAMFVPLRASVKLVMTPQIDDEGQVTDCGFSVRSLYQYFKNLPCLKVYRGHSRQG